MDLALNNLQKLICHKTQINRTKHFIFALQYAWFLDTLLPFQRLFSEYHSHSTLYQHKLSLSYLSLKLLLLIVVGIALVHRSTLSCLLSLLDPGGSLQFLIRWGYQHLMSGNWMTSFTSCFLLFFVHFIWLLPLFRALTVFCLSVLVYLFPSPQHQLFVAVKPILWFDLVLLYISC